VSATRREAPVAGAALVLSCEHATARVPARFAALFADAPDVRDTHRGWDAGAADIARRLARRFRAPLVLGRCSRLLVDLNRSPDHPRVFSAWSRRLPVATREALLADVHAAHHAAVRAAVDAALRDASSVLHVSVHSFTPHWDGRARPTQLGILDDPRRARERALSRALQRRLREALPRARVHLNRPYRGWTDGLVSRLRGELPAARYAGVELEFNQALLDPARTHLDALVNALGDALRAELSPAPERP